MTLAEKKVVEDLDKMLSRRAARGVKVLVFVFGVLDTREMRVLKIFENVYSARQFASDSVFKKVIILKGENYA